MSTPQDTPDEEPTKKELKSRIERLEAHVPGIDGVKRRDVLAGLLGLGAGATVMGGATGAVGASAHGTGNMGRAGDPLSTVYTGSISGDGSAVGIEDSFDFGGSSSISNLQSIGIDQFGGWPEYIIYERGGTYYAFNPATQTEDYSGATIDSPVNNVTNNITQGTIVLPAGTHDVGSPITNLDSITLMGQGRQKTTLRDSTAGLGEIIDARDDGTVVLWGLEIDGNGVTDTPVRFEQTASTVTRNLMFDVGVRNGTNLVNFSENEDWAMVQCNLFEAGNASLIVSATSGMGVITRCLFTWSNVQSAGAHVQLNEGKIDFVECAFEGPAANEPAGRLIQVNNNTRAAFTNCWVYSENCRNLEVTDNATGQPQIDIYGGEWILRSGSSVGTNIGATVQTNRISTFGGSFDNRGSGSYVISGSITNCGVFGTRKVNGTINSTGITNLIDDSF